MRSLKNRRLRVRYSKDRDGGVLVFSALWWAEFVGSLMRVRA
ncbi:DUF397 domain-containing protein [Saccharopolyspora sp. 5N708]